MSEIFYQFFSVCNYDSSRIKKLLRFEFIGNIHGSQSMTGTGAYLSMGIGGDSLVF